MNVLRTRWMLPIVLTALGIALSFWTVKPIPSATFITSAQPDDIQSGLRRAVEDSKIAAVIEARKIGLSLDEVKRRLTFTPLKTDEIVVSFDYGNTIAAKQVIVDTIENAGLPIVALELGKKKLPPDPLRIAIGALAGFAIGYALRQLVVTRLLPSK